MAILTGAALGEPAPGVAEPGGQVHAGQAIGRIWRAIRSNKKAFAGAILLAIFAFLAIFPWVIAHDSPEAEIYGRSLGPSAAHWLGTTSYGQDLFAQAVWGTRETLIIAVVSGALSTFLSVIMGLAAGYLGGVADAVLNFITDVLLVVPTFPLLIIIVAYLPGIGVPGLIAVLVVTGYSYGARQLRAQTLSVRSRDYLEAARVRGERSIYVIMVEIIPSMTSLIVATFLGTAVYNVLAAAGLQFLGLGNPDSVSWGTMLYWAQNNEALQTDQYMWALVPGALIGLLGAAFALLNYAFDEISNPALARVPITRTRGLNPVVRRLRANRAD
ncbi:MAG TPA: ABC transporter permease [Streptosporangiaceae bacterium]|nr:ABC transporter permease [Streptosporangiaceae bacterium]